MKLKELGQIRRYPKKTVRFENKKSTIHRDDGGPAILCSDGYKAWVVNGKRHRDGDKPAIEDKYGKEWWVNGIRHRANNKPALIMRAGEYKEWWVNGEYKRSN